MWAHLVRTLVLAGVAAAGPASAEIPAAATPVVRPFPHDTSPGPSSQRVRPYTGMFTGGNLVARIIGDSVAVQGEHEVVVMVVEPGSPADTAGLAVGDVILEVDGVAASSLTGERSPLADLATGVSYVLRIRRGEDEREVTLVPGPPRLVTRPRGLP